MANTTIGGFRFLRNKLGGNKPIMIRARVANNYATRISYGDPLVLLSDGTVAVAVGSEGTQSIIYGVANGCEYMASGVRVKNRFLPASTTFTPTTVGSVQESYVEVILAEDAIFEVDADDGTSVTTIAAAYNLVGENADHVFTAGTAANGESATLLDISTHNTTSTLQWRIVGVAGGTERLDNDVTLTRAKYEVTVNKGAQPIGTATGV